MSYRQNKGEGFTTMGASRNAHESPSNVGYGGVPLRFTGGRLSLGIR